MTILGSGRRGDLVSASRRNNLSERVTTDSELSEREKSATRESFGVASTRDACATQERGHSQTETTSLD